jgi:hypothetical protein
MSDNQTAQAQSDLPRVIGTLKIGFRPRDLESVSPLAVSAPMAVTAIVRGIKRAPYWIETEVAELYSLVEGNNHLGLTVTGTITSKFLPLGTEVKEAFSLRVLFTVRRSATEEELKLEPMLNLHRLVSGVSVEVRTNAPGFRAYTLLQVVNTKVLPLICEELAKHGTSTKFVSPTVPSLPSGMETLADGHLACNQPPALLPADQR